MQGSQNWATDNNALKSNVVIPDHAAYYLTSKLFNDQMQNIANSYNPYSFTKVNNDVLSDRMANTLGYNGCTLFGADCFTDSSCSSKSVPNLVLPGNTVGPSFGISQCSLLPLNTSGLPPVSSVVSNCNMPFADSLQFTAYTSDAPSKFDYNFSNLSLNMTSDFNKNSNGWLNLKDDGVYKDLATVTSIQSEVVSQCNSSFSSSTLSPNSPAFSENSTSRISFNVGSNSQEKSAFVFTSACGDTKREKTFVQSPIMNAPVDSSDCWHKGKSEKRELMSGQKVSETADNSEASLLSERRSCDWFAGDTHKLFHEENFMLDADSSINFSGRSSEKENMFADDLEKKPDIFSDMELFPNIETGLSRSIESVLCNFNTDSSVDLRSSLLTDMKGVNHLSTENGCLGKLDGNCLRNIEKRMPDFEKAQFCRQSGFRSTDDKKKCTSVLSSNRSSKVSASYFWQYNSQCKGPKTERSAVFKGNSLFFAQESETSDIGSPDGDCKVSSQSDVNKSQRIDSTNTSLNVFRDPVQIYNDVQCAKLRRGDGNDVTPSPEKLQNMGNVLQTMTEEMSRQGVMALGGFDLTEDQIENAKREKNKLASKICRLKKKAFHESNKIKYTALGIEHAEVLALLKDIRALLLKTLNSEETSSNSGNKGAHPRASVSSSSCSSNAQNNNLSAFLETDQFLSQPECKRLKQDHSDRETFNYASVSGFLGDYKAPTDGFTMPAPQGMTSIATLWCKSKHVSQAAGRLDEYVAEILAELDRLSVKSNNACVVYSDGPPHRSNLSTSTSGGTLTSNSGSGQAMLSKLRHYLSSSGTGASETAATVASSNSLTNQSSLSGSSRVLYSNTNNNNCSSNVTDAVTKMIVNNTTTYGALLRDH